MMELADPLPIFNTQDEELLYWKQLALKFNQECVRIQKESDEYVNDSQQLEREYEATIDQNERQIKNLTLAKNKLQSEANQFKVKLDQSAKDYSTIDSELSILKKERNSMVEKIRLLEQKNDDLERSRRIIEGSIQDIKDEFNSAIERNAILESEVDDKETLKEKLQRLLDETKDLKQELLVKERDRQVETDRLLTDDVSNKVDSNRLKETETQTTPIKNDSSVAPLSPTSRIMAINLVSDLIRKVSSLERRLEKYRQPKSVIKT